MGLQSAGSYLSQWRSREALMNATVSVTKTIIVYKLLSDYVISTIRVCSLPA
jgi:hypothetical protein